MDADWGERLERFRAYLTLMARLQIDGKARAKLSASDLVQKTFLEAFEARGTFRGTSEAELAAWLRKALAHNLADALKGLQRGKRDVGRERSLDEAVREASGRLGSLLDGKQRSPTSLVSRDEQAARLARALEKLPEAQAEAVVLRHLLGKPLAEIAALRGTTEAAAAGLLHRGLAGLRELLKGSE